MNAEDTERTATSATEVPRTRKIDSSEIHLWAMSFKRLEPEFGVLDSLLSEDERGRARRYRHLGDCHRFILGRGQLRKLLEAYTGIPAKNVAFSYGPFGKPGLGGRPSIPDIRFNTSHTSNMIVYLFGLNYDVGIDLETNFPQDDCQDYYSLILSSQERARVDGAADEMRTEMFLRYWTRKEACLKALGTGFSFEPSRIDISKAPFVKLAHDCSLHIDMEEPILFFTDFKIRGRYSGAIARKNNAIPKIVPRYLLD